MKKCKIIMIILLFLNIVYVAYLYGYYKGRISGIVSGNIFNVLVMYSYLKESMIDKNKEVIEKSYANFTKNFLIMNIQMIHRCGGIEKAVKIANDGNDDKSESIMKKQYYEIKEYSNEISNQ